MDGLFLDLDVGDGTGQQGWRAVRVLSIQRCTSDTTCPEVRLTRQSKHARNTSFWRKEHCSLKSGNYCTNLMLQTPCLLWSYHFGISRSQISEFSVLTISSPGYAKLIWWKLAVDAGRRPGNLTLDEDLHQTLGRTKPHKLPVRNRLENLLDGWETLRSSLAPHWIGNMNTPSSEPLPHDHWIDISP